MNRHFTPTDALAVAAKTDVLPSVPRNVRLQYLRALAAISVLLFHASVIVERTTGSGTYLATFGGYWGALGVAIFFALSGYLMRELIQRDDPARFLISRVARIYPPMMLVIGLSWLAFFAAGLPRGIDLIGLTLAPAGVRDYFLGVEWTLLYEVSYYVILAGLSAFGLRRLASLFAVAWIAAILISILATGRAALDQMPLASELPLQAVNLPFLLGFILPDVKGLRVLPAGILLAAVPTALVGSYFLPASPALSVVVPAVLSVAAAVRFPKAQATNAAGKAGEALGDASYMLYLCHMPLMTLAAGFVSNSWPSLLVWFGGVGSSIAIALVLGRADLKIHRWFKRATAKASLNRLRDIAVFFVALFLGTSVLSEYLVREKRTLEERARLALASTEPTMSTSIRAKVDAVQNLPDGTRVVRGYAIDLDHPNLAVHVAAVQNGQVVAIERVRRMRLAQARDWLRPDLANVRFGFVLMLPKNVDCSAGLIDVRAAFQDDRVVISAIEPEATICP
ncbi:acyltransferase [Bosea sp. ASV33]|uniref:acyltransferase family protein n=1 Tax=Bosea sp. ASV33 TaxID=2795106 RepID=UPI0018ED532E|nr:acyltransferase [Bosea sp. ASV33]